MKIEFTVGKYTLESLTNGMYASPLDLYREYIQNAVDSFDEVLLFNTADDDKFKIEVSLISSTNTVVIRDNGGGINKDNAAKTLLDIGNSKKRRSVSRGFRGIGRLAGLGYCERLTFTTSAISESIKTVISFDAKRLKALLITTNEDNMSIQEVLEEIVTIKTFPEKANAHYFEVILEQVDMAGKLLNYDVVKEYLIQHSPLPFDKSFKWGSLIINKFNLLGCKIQDYNLILRNDEKEERLFKPYQNSFVSDRVKKLEDTIQDISIVPLYRGEKLSAVLWYAQASYLGTILDNTIKGIRIRQGNILVGGKTTCNQFFKEERFNGWIIGELHIFDDELIINSRRDEFEKNVAYYEFVELLSDWSLGLTKEIRRKSYDRSLTNEKKAIVEIENFEDVNALGTEDLDFANDVYESSFIDESDSDFVAESDFYDKLSMIINHRKAQTKYSALNINERLTAEQRKVLERVFDVITQEYEKDEAEKFISIISKKY